MIETPYIVMINIVWRKKKNVFVTIVPIYGYNYRYMSVQSDSVDNS